jgi:DNA-binding transcriptional LysR family regulator
LKDSISIKNQDFSRLQYFDWDKAKDFYYVAKLGSFSEAGKFLNISQSSLSRKIKILEDHLNFKVFSRLPHGLELTRKGEELFTIIERTFLDLKGITYNSVVMANNGKKRKIRIVTTHALASYVFCDLIIEYNKLHRDIIFELIGNDYSLDIVLNDVDIAIRPIDITIKDNPSEQGIQKEVVCSLAKRLYASEEYLKTYGTPQTVEELKSHSLIAFSQASKHPYANVNWILTLGMPEGNLHDPVFTSNSVECMIEAAKKSIGIVGSYREMKIIRDSRLINILPHVTDKEIKDFIIYPNHLKNDKDIIDFKDYLIERLYLKN